MITFAKEEQSLLDLGWPRMVRFVEGRRDKTPEQAAIRWGATWADDVRHSEWPRKTAEIAVRVGPRIVPTTKKRKLHKGEPGEILAQQLAVFSGHSTSGHAREWVFLIEALIGADATLDAIASGFESICKNPRDVFQLAVQTGVTSAIGFMLLRAKNAKAHAKRLEAFRVTLASKKDHWYAMKGYLDASLNGRAGVDRYLAGVPRNVIEAEYAHDDADYVRACVDEADPSEPFSVRLAAIAGPDVMKNIARRKFYADDLPSVLRDFGMIKTRETVELALSFVGRTTAKDAPVKWIAAHADYAMPIVEAAARKGNAKAKAVAKIISAGRTEASRPSS
jgi:hypothetical protein